MPFDQLAYPAINQGPHPHCGAASAAFVARWCQYQAVPNSYNDQVALSTTVMRDTCLTRCTYSLGSTPANIASYIKKQCPAARIYAPTEIATNWSLRPWYIFLRPALHINLSTTNFSMGWKCLIPNGIMGQDYVVIKMISKRPYEGCMEYLGAHFVVQVDDTTIMDPADGDFVDAGTYLNGGYCAAGYASVGLDLYVFRPPPV
ncbi:hypothetical protein [Novispirillum itersonii]|uniref:hypothetical protein n=1 Tax=Novispirillum itersonii TaxID=189 RepID=UPI0012DE756B|nr:hypothetical protein [Novispirillum itersonii]